MKEIYDGSTTNRTVKREWIFCPRCSKPAISRDLRKCRDCGGRVLFDGDQANDFNLIGEYWYMWHRPVFGIKGWYPKSYFYPDIVGNPFVK